MTRYTRRIFFYSAVVLFALLAPLIIAYSLGYTFDVGTRSLEQTGGIFIKSKTPRMSVFLDGVFIKETSYFSGGALLTEITPGVHHLRLEKTGYHPWSKTIKVDPSLVTDFRNVLLISDPPSIASSTRDELTSLHTYATSGSFRPITPKETVSVPDLSVPPQSLPAFSLDNKHNLIEKTATTSKIFLPYINSFSVIDAMIYFIDKNGFLGKINPLSKDITTIGRPGFYLSNQPAQFSQALNGDIMILDASGGLFISDGSTNIQAITGSVRQFAFDGKGAKMLIRKDNSIDIYWLEDNAFQPFQKSGTKEQVFASDALIQDADWFFADNAHIVIRTPDSIFLTEIDARDGKNLIRLFPEKTDELVTIPSLPNSIFFRKEKTFFTISL